MEGPVCLTVGNGLLWQPRYIQGCQTFQNLFVQSRWYTRKSRSPTTYTRDINLNTTDVFTMAQKLDVAGDNIMCILIATKLVYSL